MKRIALLATLSVALLGGLVLRAADDKPKTPTTKPATTKPVDPKPVNKFCAVEGKGHDIDPKVTVIHNGKTIGFCCADCIDEFKKDPEKYVKKME